jgi:urea carboxylase-associated protein 2
MTRLDEHATDTVGNARADARAQDGLTSEYMPYLPASASPFAPTGVDPASLTWAETVAPGGYTHRVIARGTHLRLDDPTGEASAHVLLFNADEPWERLNTADTVKIPWQAYLGAGHPLLSGDGRVLASVVADTSGHHDALFGTSTDAANQARFGDARPEGPAPSGRALFLKAAAKHGLSARDLPPSISFFQGVKVGWDGAIEWLGSAGPDASVTLVAELPLIVLIANVMHPADPARHYRSGPLRVHAWHGSPTLPGNPRFDSSPESRRAYLNTIDYAEARA